MFTLRMRAVSGKETVRAGYSFSTITIRTLEELYLSSTDVLFPVKTNSIIVNGKNSFSM
jgi:hypothetical protein